jgi:hypothetical protein
MLCYPANGRVDDYCGQSAYEILNCIFVLCKIETFSHQDPHPTIKKHFLNLHLINGNKER